MSRSAGSLRLLFLQGRRSFLCLKFCVIPGKKCSSGKSYITQLRFLLDAKDYLQENFGVDLAPYDLIVGYRADDSYFSFAQDFVAGVISLDRLSVAMRLGKLGEQLVLKSREAFQHIRFLGVEPVDAAVYYQKKIIRDREARRADRRSKQLKDSVSGLFMIDIMREGITNGDPRLR